MNDDDLYLQAFGIAPLTLDVKPKGLRIILPTEEGESTPRSMTLAVPSVRGSYVGWFDLDKYNQQKEKEKTFIDHFKHTMSPRVVGMTGMANRKP